MKLKELFNYPPFQNNVAEDYAVGVQTQLPDFNSRWAKIIGTSDGRDVWGSKCWGEDIDVYAFRTKTKVDAFLAINNIQVNGAFPLIRVYVNPTQRGKGLASSLLGFITKKMNNHVIITKVEPLTNDGINWLVKLIKQPNGFKIHNGSNLPLDADAVLKDWERAKVAGQSTDMEIFIENFRSFQLWGAGKNTLTEASQHLGCEDLD